MSPIYTASPTTSEHAAMDAAVSPVVTPTVATPARLTSMLGKTDPRGDREHLAALNASLDESVAAGPAQGPSPSIGSRIGRWFRDLGHAPLGAEPVETSTDAIAQDGIYTPSQETSGRLGARALTGGVFDRLTQDEGALGPGDSGVRRVTHRNEVAQRDPGRFDTGVWESAQDINRDGTGLD